MSKFEFNEFVKIVEIDVNLLNWSIKSTNSLKSMNLLKVNDLVKMDEFGKIGTIEKLVKNNEFDKIVKIVEKST